MIPVGGKIDTRFPIKVFREGQATAISFGELLHRLTVVSVYMRNNTPGCDRQNDSLAVRAPEIARAGFDLVALSRDTAGSHGKYAAKKKISYPLVSDPDDLFAKAADAVVEKSMYGRKFSGPARTVFILGADGTVLALEKVDTSDHAAQVLAMIARLKTGT